MDEKTLELIETARKTDPQLDKLMQTHHQLNAQVDELNSQSHLTDSETVELSRLKKEKLRIRDLIEQAVQGQRSA